MIVSLTIFAVFVVVTAIASPLRDLLRLPFCLSFLMALIWVELQSVDVGFTEAAVGAGATTAFLIAAISRTTRWEKK
jgi:multicomponent Na+:H+ antiporter subunit B